MRIITASLFILLSLQVAGYSKPNNPFQNPLIKGLESNHERILRRCHYQTDLMPAAKALIKRYFENEMLNSEFYRDFLWLHPESEPYASCLICESGRPNDPYWEFDFKLRCQEQDQDSFYYAAEPGEEDLEEV
jgi:hypothetical protein